MELGTYGSIIGKLMDDRGVTQHELAKRVGCSPTTISKLRSDGGTGLSAEMLRRLCAGLGVDPCTVLQMLPPVVDIRLESRRGRGRPKKEI